MCEGSGKHDLRPPNGETYLILSVFGGGGGAFSYLQTMVNTHAERGYEVQQILPNGPNFTVAIMRWRWR